MSNFKFKCKIQPSNVKTQNAKPKWHKSNSKYQKMSKICQKYQRCQKGKKCKKSKFQNVKDVKYAEYAKNVNWQMTNIECEISVMISTSSYEISVDLVRSQ